MARKLGNVVLLKAAYGSRIELVSMRPAPIQEHLERLREKLVAAAKLGDVIDLEVTLINLAQYQAGAGDLQGAEASSRPPLP